MRQPPSPFRPTRNADLHDMVSWLCITTELSDECILNAIRMMIADGTIAVVPDFAMPSGMRVDLLVDLSDLRGDGLGTFKPRTGEGGGDVLH